MEVCGDGLVDSAAGEQCDDGGTTPGDGCDAECQLDAFSSIPPTLISGALSCTTANSNTGLKVAVDALGRFYVVMRCGGAVHVSVSVDRGFTWVGPTPLGITNAAEVAIEGGPTGTEYVAATSAGAMLFTRTVDSGALGNGYIASQRQTGNTQLDRMLVGATVIESSDARTIGPGTVPAVAALPSNGGALVAYTNGTSVYGSVVVY